MIKNIIYIILIFFISIPCTLLGQYTLKNTGGSINNSGTIRVKHGITKDLPDTLDGRIEFLQKGAMGQQTIPNIVYNQLMIANNALKLISDERNDGGVIRSIVVRDSLIVSDSADFSSRWIGLKAEEVHAKSTVSNTAKYTSGKDMVLNGTDKAQDLIGNGSFSRLRIENKFGVNVVGGGFTVEEKLTLKEGELRNNAENNFSMLDSSLVIRHVGSSLTHEPLLEKQITVQYTGDGSLTTGAEIPKDEKALKNLHVNVTENLTLDRNVSVMDTLEVGAGIIAIDDTLTLQGALNPLFTSVDPGVEIDGNFRRNTLLTGEKILLNHRNIWVTFNTEADKGGVTALVSNIRARTFHNLPSADQKVKRSYTLGGVDANGNVVTGGINMIFGFGWRHTPDDINTDESNGLTPEELVLQRWIDDRWFNLEPKSSEPVVNFGTAWATGMIEQLNNFGQFALGMSSSEYFAYIFRAQFYLEGAYIAGSRGVMTHDLWTRNLIGQADLAAYPTNLDMNLAADFLTQIPDSVVDIVVLEFRKERNMAPSFVKTGYLRYDGTFVDSRGNSAINIDTADGISQDGGSYFVAVRHRNHAAIITDNPIEIIRSNEDVVYNFSDPSIIEGGAAALKLVYTDNEGKKVFALKGGFLADDADGLNGQLNFLNNYTRNFEHQSAFLGFTREGYLNVDFNLSGIVNTKDFNVTWNNRGLK